MRASVPLAALAATIASGVASGAAAPHRTLHPGNAQTCSGAEGFPRSSFTDPDSLVVGPLMMAGAVAAADIPPGDARLRHGLKLLVAVRFHHRATISVDREARSFARLQYGDGPARFRNTPAKVRFVACRRVAPGQHGSLPPDSVRASFFPGGISARHIPVCVPITIRVDRREPVHRTVGLGTHCPES
jgi:hypothetical protein